MLSAGWRIANYDGVRRLLAPYDRGLRTSMGPAEKEKVCRSLRSLRASFFLLLLKASFHRKEKIKPAASSGQAFSLVG